ncbi:MAG: PilZ domain-containing protein [Desulfuromonadales bacterium]|nr:PilZ domain-containing protein [Desulfuromonadales bacterium]
MTGTVPHPAHENSYSDREHTLSRKALVNHLNYLNFKDQTLLVNLQHPRYRHLLTLSAHPQPCLGGTLDCRWDEQADLPENLGTYLLKNLLVNDGNKLFLVRPALLHMDAERVSFALPESCSEIHLRASKRHHCDNVRVQVVQNGILFHGQLINFTPDAFEVELILQPPQMLSWINQDASAVVLLQYEEQTRYSGSCRFIRRSPGRDNTLLLAPLAKRIQRFKPKHYRSNRETLVPSPRVLFDHPLTGQRTELKTHDLSGSGVSVKEPNQEALLFPGLLIPELQLVFADSKQFSCQAQVVYQRPFNENGHGMKLSGLAFLDMGLADHGRLVSILQQLWDGNAYLGQREDPDALWKFFFETGFMYPQKYSAIVPHKQAYQEICKKLYTENPEVARHFTYRENGAILGHIAMLRMYTNSWLLHHHTAIRSEVKRAGLMVLRQIGRSINDSHNLYSAHMRYVMCYYQPENRFPQRVFGGVAEYCRNRKSCSVDAFAYFHFRQNFDRPWDLAEPWSLTRTEVQELEELQSYYEQVSGGLMLQALDLVPSGDSSDELQERFRALGFKRERYLYSLKKDGELKALILVNLSDPGLDFASLTNSIKVIVLDQEDLPKETLELMLALLSVKFELEEPAVLLFPRSYAEQNRLAVEKSYLLWVLDCQNTDPYFEFCEKLLKEI